MRIGLLDVDGHNFPNLPLMKVATYFKNQGHDVEFYEPLNGWYDKVYISKVLSFSEDYQYNIYADEVFRGGTGYSLTERLPHAIENMYPDYSLYATNSTAYGFLTRGCPRQCGFCIVSSKEGCRSEKVSNLDGFWRGQKEIKLLDPNLLACEDRIELLQQLIDIKAWIDFTQGLDIRCMNEEIADLVVKCKVKMIHFAWDQETGSEYILRKLKEFKTQTNMSMYKARVYVLVNFDTAFGFDLFRIYALKDLGYDPYVMVYDKEKAEKKYRKLQRWVNNKFIFRSCERFEDYKTG